MKTKAGVLILLLAATLAHAQTNQLTALLQQGLFEEQANRNLDAAIADYQSLAAQFDQDRQLAATAVFRLGECYRMQGKTNEAAAQYQRILRDFSDQTTLATLSRQNLGALGSAPRTAAGLSASSQATAELMSTIVAKETEAAALKAQLDELQKLNPSKRTVAVQQSYSNPVLTKLTQDLAEAQQKLVVLSKDYAPNHPSFLNARKAKETIKQQIDQQVDDVVTGLQSRMNADLATAKALRAQLQKTAAEFQLASQNSPAPADAEDQEIQRIRQMIQNSPDLINSARAGGTPLSRAASAGWLRAAAFLLDHGADVNLKAAGRTPLACATASGNKTMVEFLLDHGADVNARDDNGDTPLHIAAESRFYAVAEVLLNHGADVNARKSQQNGERTPLDLAAEKGDSELVSLLLTHQAKINVQDKVGNTPLLWAVKGGHAKTVRKLLSAGANVNVKNQQGRTALSYAAETGSPEMVKVLLDAKADPNGGTLDAPLLCAIQKRDVLSAELLLNAGANPNAEGKVEQNFERNNGSWQVSPLWLAVTTKQFPMVQLLLKFKADPNDTQTDGRSLLFDTLSDTNILTALLDAGAKVDSVDSTRGFGFLPKWTPLGAAAYLNLKDAAAVRILLKSGADPNVRNPDDLTPLHWAAFGLADREIFLMLLDDGANPNVRSKSGKTPLDILKEKFASNTTSAEGKTLSSQLADLLRQHGALDHLPDWDRIEVSRPSANFSSAIFHKGTNNWNQFTLFDLLGVQYDLLTASTRGVSRVRSSPYSRFASDNSLPYPDFTSVIIHRPAPSGTNWHELKINLVPALKSGDCSADVPLHFGDVVEIPEADHVMNEKWSGLTTNELFTLKKCLTRHLQITVHGKITDLTLSPGVEELKPGDVGYQGVYLGQSGSAGSAGTVPPPVSLLRFQPFMLWPVLENSNLLLASSDLSRVHVKRSDSATGKIHEWTLDCSNPGTRPDFWLRDGDVIEVPEKP